MRLVCKFKFGFRTLKIFFFSLINVILRDQTLKCSLDAMDLKTVLSPLKLHVKNKK